MRAKSKPQRDGATTKNQNPPRRHGDTEKIKTNFHHREHRGHGGELESKSWPEGAEEDQSNKICAKTKNLQLVMSVVRDQRQKI